MTRKLTGFDATMLVMGGILGVGIFFTPQEVARSVSEPWAFMLVWVVGGLLALSGAFTFAELGAGFPRAGGWFVYLREAFGPLVAFLFAWVVLFVVSTGAMAVVASFCAGNLLALVPALETSLPAPETTLPALILLALTLIVACGIKIGALFQNGCMLLKLGAVGLLIGAGWAFGSDAAPVIAEPVVAEPVSTSFERPTLWRGLFAAMLPVLFSYGGWQFLGYTAREVRNPERTLPRAILIGVLSVVAIYLALNAACLRVLGLEGVAADGFAAELASRTLGEHGERFLTFAMAVSSLGVCAVITIATPWIYVAMAREGLFLRSFGVLHARTGAPLFGLGLQCAVALAYLFFFGTEVIDELTGTVVFAEWIFHALVALGLILLRRARPAGWPYRSPLFPLMPAIYLGLAIAVVGGNLVQADLETTGIGLGVLAVGALVYWPWRRAMGGGRVAQP